MYDKKEFSSVRIHFVADVFLKATTHSQRLNWNHFCILVNSAHNGKHLFSFSCHQFHRKKKKKQWNRFQNPFSIWFVSGRFIFDTFTIPFQWHLPYKNVPSCHQYSKFHFYLLSSRESSVFKYSKHFIWRAFFLYKHGIWNAIQRNHKTKTETNWVQFVRVHSVWRIQFARFWILCSFVYHFHCLSHLYKQKHEFTKRTFMETMDKMLQRSFVPFFVFQFQHMSISFEFVFQQDFQWTFSQFGTLTSMWSPFPWYGRNTVLKTFAFQYVAGEGSFQLPTSCPTESFQFKKTQRRCSRQDVFLSPPWLLKWEFFQRC